MSNDEIFARIAADVMDAGNGNFGVRDITIGITRELFSKLAPLEMLAIPDGQIATLFGCKIKILENSGLWWIVGYMNDIEEAKNDN